MASFWWVLVIPILAFLETATPFQKIALAQRQAAGTIVFKHAPDGGAPWPVEDIYSMDADGANVKALTNDGHSHNPSWSPDGRRILFVHDSALSAKPPYRVDLYVMDKDGSNRHLLRHLEPVIHSAVWSPDGKSLAITCIPEAWENRPDPMDRVGLFVLPADGQGEPRLLFRNAYTPAWSPYGKRLAFSLEKPSGRCTSQILMALMMCN
jgi:Tol biopolymer transport system component